MVSKKYPVKFFKGTLQQYNSITPNDYTFYFITDVDKIYLGDVQLSNTDVYARIEAINEALQGVASIEAKTTAEWNQQLDIIGESNKFYIYTDRTQKEDEHGHIINCPGIKVGDGSSYLIDLPFVDDLFYDHVTNMDIHVTLAEKQFWNNKVRTQDSEIDQQNLIFTIY